MRYKKLVSYIEENLSEELSISKVEAVSHYSYRNINRIFQGLHGETIGKYVKRLRLEKAAQYLKYSEMGIRQIALEVGFEDRSVFSKAFKKRFKCSPQAFRDQTIENIESIIESLSPQNPAERAKLNFEIILLPHFEYLFLEYRGSFEDHEAINEAWNKLLKYAEANKLLNRHSMFFTEVVDDLEISDHIHSRYNLAIAFEEPIALEPSELFRKRSHRKQKYVKFQFDGSIENSKDFYQQIYAFWMFDVKQEFVDLPILEFYIPSEEKAEEIKGIEIYIPIL